MICSRLRASISAMVGRRGSRHRGWRRGARGRRALRRCSGTISTQMPLRPARPVRPAAVQQRFGVGRQVGVDDEVEVGQVDAAGGDVGGDADAGAAVAHRLQRVGALGLAQFAGERRRPESRDWRGGRSGGLHGLAGVAEDDGALSFVKQQHVDDGVLALVVRTTMALVLDVGVLLARRWWRRGAARRAGRSWRDRRWRAARWPRTSACARSAGGIEDELEVFAEAEVEHLVGLVEHHGADVAEIERAR